MKDKTDEELIELYKNGDSSAFDEIYYRYKGLVKYHCRSYTMLGGDENDLMQEGMLGLIKSVNNYKKGDCSFKTYASLCIKTSVYTALKKNSNEKLPLNNTISIDEINGLEFIGLSPEEEAINNENGEKLKNTLTKILSKLEFKVLKYYLSGLSYIEIANKIGKTVKSVDGTLCRIKKKIIKNYGV